MSNKITVDLFYKTSRNEKEDQEFSNQLSKWLIE